MMHYGAPPSARHGLLRCFKTGPGCGFEVAPETPPYSGVRGQGHAELLPGEGIPVLLRLVDRYLGTRETRFARWLIGRGDAEVAIRIRPDWLTSWDFSGRM